MPILKPGDTAFAGFDLGQPFTSVLPDEHIMQGGAVSKFYRDITQGESVSLSWKNYSRIARIAVGFIGITRGIAKDRMPAVASLFTEAVSITTGLLEAVMKESVIEGALLTFDKALNMVATKVPLVGWVVQLGLFVYDLIKLAINGVQVETDKKAQGKAIAYARGADQDVVRSVLETLKGPDWTKVFLPQQTPNDVEVVDLAYTDRGNADGVGWQVSGQAKGWGFTPGLSSRWTGMVGYFQSPRKMPGSSRDAGATAITGMGELHPASVQLGMLVWQMVVKNSVEAFMIDGQRIVTAWRDEFGTLQDYADKHADQWLAGQMYQGMQWWDVWNEQTRVEGFEPDTLPGKYVNNQYERFYSDLVAYIVEQFWAPRLPGFLETLTVAYVPPDAPALKADSKLADKHTEMRALLLKHKAAKQVDLDLVPDDEYRDALWHARLTVDPWIAVNPGTGKATAVDYVAPIDPELPPTPPPDNEPAPGMSPAEPEADSPTGSAAIAVVGIAAVTAAALRAL